MQRFIHINLGLSHNVLDLWMWRLYMLFLHPALLVMHQTEYKTIKFILMFVLMRIHRMSQCR